MHKIDRIEQDIKYYLSKILLEEVKLPNNIFITLTSVKVTKDLKYAKVYVSIFGSKHITESFEKLQAKKGIIKKSLSSKLKARNIPELIFELDDSIEYGSRMNKVIQDVIDKDNRVKEEKNKE